LPNAHTDTLRHTDTQITLCATAVAIGRIFALMQAMRPKTGAIQKIHWHFPFFFKVIRFRGARGHRQHDDDTAADADDEFSDDELTIID